MSIKPGRPSAASMATKPIAKPKRQRASALAPDGSLTPDERAIYTRVWKSQPAGYFSAAITPLLENYARAIACGHVIARATAAILTAPELDEARLIALRAAADRESRSAAALARALRITNQSRWQPATAARLGRDHAASVAAHGGKLKPWQWVDDGGAVRNGRD